MPEEAGEAASGALQEPTDSWGIPFANHPARFEAYMLRASRGRPGLSRPEYEAIGLEWCERHACPIYPLPWEGDPPPCPDPHPETD